MELLPQGDAGAALLAVATLTVAIGAFVQASTGIAFVLICGPALVAAAGPEAGVATALTLAVLANLGPLAAHVRDVDTRSALLMFVPALLATPLVALALHRLDEDASAALAGLAVLIGAVILALGVRWRRAHGPGGAAATGVVSATMNYLGAVGGPAAALYAANADWTGARTRATLQAYLLGLNVATLAVIGPVPVPLVLALALVAGSAAGVLTARRVDDLLARRVTLAFAAVGGAAVLAQALV